MPFHRQVTEILVQDGRTFEVLLPPASSMVDVEDVARALRGRNPLRLTNTRTGERIALEEVSVVRLSAPRHTAAAEAWDVEDW